MVIPLFDYVAHYSVAKQGDADAKTTANKEPDDLEMIGGTSEDDFSEAIALVRFELNPKIPLTMQREGAAFWDAIFTGALRPVVGRNMLKTGIVQGLAFAC